jgi:hypothetical protein
MWEFFSERVALEPWQDGTVPVEVEVEQPTRPIAPVPPEPPAAARR